MKTHPSWVLEKQRRYRLLQKHGYKDLKKLGEGAFGAVYSAVDSRTPEVVVKVMSSEKKDPRNTLNCHQNEITVLEALKEKTHCQDTLCLMDSLVDGHYTFLIYTWIPDSISLDKYVELYKTDETYTLDFTPAFLLIAKGLEILHKVKIVHNDIKPENIMLVVEQAYPPDQPPPDQLAYFIDFGLACHPTGEKCPCFRDGGTPSYMAPELLKHAISYSVEWTFEMLKQCDVFSLGVVFYQLRHNMQFPVKDVASLIQEWEQRVPDFGGRRLSTNVRENYYLGIDILIEMMLKPKDRPTMSRVVHILESLNMLSELEDEIIPKSRDIFKELTLDTWISKQRRNTLDVHIPHKTQSRLIRTV